MRTIIEIAIPTVSYDHDVSNLAGYLQMIAGELTKTPARVSINDFDFTSSVDVFKQMRRPSIFNRD